jgi:hypothetical protein
LTPGPALQYGKPECEISEWEEEWAN